MKYIILCTVAFIICFLIGYLIARLSTRKKPNKYRLKRVLLTLGFGIVFMLAVSFIYLGICYTATAEASAALNGNETVTVTKVDGGYFFDGPGEECAIVFYPGAKVASEAYAPLLLKISERGIDCFCAEMPFHFALLGANKADSFMNAYRYNSWYLAGHSMGGIVATQYAVAHQDKVAGIILLAAYPSEKIADNQTLLSIYGTEDGILDKKAYDETIANRPMDSAEYIIEGGNHSQYGNYGEQDGDTKALITSARQQEETANVIGAFCNELSHQ